MNRRNLIARAAALAVPAALLPLKTAAAAAAPAADLAAAERVLHDLIEQSIAIQPSRLEGVVATIKTMTAGIDADASVADIAEAEYEAIADRRWRLERWADSLLS